MNSNLYLIRHGQSTYNLENRFTGWRDVDLTELGQMQAKEASNLLTDYKFDLAFTSNLIRAQKTLDIILSNLGISLKVIKNEALNERDYGDLVGQNKDDASKKFGKDQVQIWRRSFNTPPPNGESLEMTFKRTVPYFKSVIRPHLLNGKNIVISAHGNSIRSIIMELLKYDSNQILKTEVGWCEPVIFSFNKHGNIKNFKLITRPSESSKSNFPKIKY